MNTFSYRNILRSSALIGGSQVVSIVTSAAKMKVTAVILGPAGVGLVGLYANLIQTASAISALGIGTAGTRQVAAAHGSGDEIAVGRVRRALFWGTLGLALLGCGILWLFRGYIAESALGDRSHANDVAWLSLGVALTVGSMAQTAVLTGLQKIADLARIGVWSSVIGAILGIAAIKIWATGGIIVSVLIAPALTFILGRLYAARLGAPPGPKLRPAEVFRQLRDVIHVGIPFMASALVLLAGQFLVRVMVQRELGLNAVGQFQAAWTIGIIYLSFVFGAMATDYYPRLTAVAKDRATTVRLVNEQAEVAVLLCSPVILAMLGLSPWIIRLFYTAEFAPAIELLRWQLLGDLLKVAAFPLGYVILAAGAGRTFLLLELLYSGTFLVGVAVGLPRLGLIATGIAYVVQYLIVLPLDWWLVRRRTGFGWTRAVQIQMIVVALLAVIVELAARWSQLLGASVAVVASAGTVAWAMMRLSKLVEAQGRLGKAAALGERIRLRLRPK